MSRSIIFAAVLVISTVVVIECHQNHQPNAYQAQPSGGYQNQQQYQQPQHQQNQMMNNINKDHVLEHLDGVINKPKDQMSADEQNFYYFKLHDYDNNNMLDGLELVSAFAHNDEHKDSHDPNQPAENPHPPRISDDELIRLIDEIMKDEDKNLDGYIAYNEFLQAIKA